MKYYTPYFYIIQNTNNGLYYAGSKYGRDANPDSFMTENGYKTSSNTINKIIEEFGLNVFRIRKIKIFNTGEEAKNYETKFLKRIRARHNLNFYNCHENEYCLDKESSKKFYMNLYGVEYYSQSEDWKDKVEKTSISKYGKKHFLSDENIREKIKITNMNRYGGNAPACSDEVIEKMKQTNMEKYNVDNFSKSIQFKNMMKERNLQEYGVETYYQSDDFKMKSKKTKLEKYGNETYNNRNKVITTNIEKYGIPNYVNKEKIEQTNTEKYGVKTQFHRSEIQDKINENKLKKSKRSNVLYLRKISKMYKIKIGKGWYVKNDDFINEKIKEIEILYNLDRFDPCSQIT